MGDELPADDLTGEGGKDEGKANDVLPAAQLARVADPDGVSVNLLLTPRVVDEDAVLELRAGSDQRDEHLFGAAVP